MLGGRVVLPGTSSQLGCCGVGVEIMMWRRQVMAPEHVEVVGMGKELTYGSVSRCSQSIAGAVDVVRKRRLIVSLGMQTHGIATRPKRD